MKKSFILLCCAALLVVLISGCPTGLVIDASTFTASAKTIFDGAHSADANQHFFFLPPIVPQPAYDGSFDPSLSPVVEIVGPGLDYPIAFSMDGGADSETIRVVPEGEHYIVNWHTDNLYDPDTDNIYRIIVKVNENELGHADVQVVDTGKAMRNVDTNECVALKDGRTLPIKFLVGRVPVSGVTLNKDATSITAGNTEQLIATVSPSDAIDPSVFWTSDNPLVATVSSDGTVDAITPGIATIMVHTNDGGFTDTCEVTVPGFVFLNDSRYIATISGESYEAHAIAFEDFDATVTSTHTNSSGEYIATAYQYSTLEPFRLYAEGGVLEYGPTFAYEPHLTDAISFFSADFEVIAQSGVSLAGELDLYWYTEGYNFGISSYTVTLKHYDGAVIYTYTDDQFTGSPPPVFIDETFLLEPGIYTLSAEASAGTNYHSEPNGPHAGGTGWSDYIIDFTLPLSEVTP